MFVVRALIAVSNFQKIDAASACLYSLVEHDYAEGNRILLTCDNGGKPYTLTRAGNPEHPLLKEVDSLDMPSAPEAVQSLREALGIDIVCLHTGKREGVAVNKNRAIHYFLNHPEFDELLLLDDDIVMTGAGLLEACRETNEPHMTGMLGGQENAVFGSVKAPFFETFPVMGARKTHVYAAGSMGMMLWFTREAVERAGYFNKMPDFYGAEHSLYSNRINALYGKFIDWFPILKDCGRFFISQSIPNNYKADYEKNMKYWAKLKPEIFKGINLKVTSPGFNIKDIHEA